MKHILHGIGFFGLLILVAGCMDGLAMDNDIGDTPEGRARIVAFVEPGSTRFDDVVARFGDPVAIQGLPDDLMQANYSSYFGGNGYAAVVYNAYTKVVERVAAYRLDDSTEKHILESSKP